MREPESAFLDGFGGEATVIDCPDDHFHNLSNTQSQSQSQGLGLIWLKLLSPRFVSVLGLHNKLFDFLFGRHFFSSVQPHIYRNTSAFAPGLPSRGSVN